MQRRAMALAASRALPPPRPIMAWQFSLLVTSVPRSTVFKEGFGSTSSKRTVATPAAAQEFSTFCRKPIFLADVLPVTMITLWPSSATSLPVFSIAPGPKIIRVGK